MLARFIRAVAILALPAGDQAEWIKSLGVAPSVDELALELDDGARLAAQFVDAGWLSAQIIPPLEALDSLLNNMSGINNAPLWDLDALDSSPRWAEVRVMAKDILIVIN